MQMIEKVLLGDASFWGKSKKQNYVSLSTAKAEYIATGSGCTQLLWMKQMLKEYNVLQDVMTLYCDNLSAINISKNPIQHTRTKHINIHHHFIKDLVEEKIIALEHVETELQLADIFTKALDVAKFEKLRGKLGICKECVKKRSKLNLFDPALVMESSCEPNFSFGFNDIHYSDRVLRIEFIPDPVYADRHRMKKRQKVLNGNQPVDMDDDDETCVNNDSNSAAATVVRVETLHISSLILAAQSPFFLKLFSNGMSETKQRHISLRIYASEEDGLMELLKFLYSNTLNITAAPALLDVLMAADKFDVPSCMRYLLNLPMTPDSASLYLELPHTVDAFQPLIDAAKQYLVGRYREITNDKYREKHMALSLSAIEAILASDGLQVSSEDGVYDFALNWARQKYDSLKERREVLATRLACLIRFPYMTCQKLEDVLTCNDFEHESASKLVLEALSSKAEAPHCQRPLAAEESISLNRRFRARAYKQLFYMHLEWKDCVSLFPSGHVDSEPFDFGGQMFFLSAQCNMDNNGSHCFALSLGMKESCSGSIDVDYEFTARLKKTKEFISLHKSNCTFNGGTHIGCKNLFDVPWTFFIEENSIFFVNGSLHLAAELTITH
ncbi:BTB/POZ domain-containing protein At2g46260-like [Lotus japonicus]|uniref:BTB/POZ domain-containing protein At2g46260-like n=1 Tax=Lotus japonicus TaxID=34305 RepID=UPI0025911F87|nr:BTB/POZ domain-containing protein At2g46260-like [Lotus japonicus]